MMMMMTRRKVLFWMRIQSWTRVVVVVWRREKEKCDAARKEKKERESAGA